MTEVSILKASSPKAKTLKAKAGPTNFILLDNEDDTFTVMGVDKAGYPVDISTVATIVVTSDNTAILTVDPPVGMTSAMHAVGPIGSCNLDVVATWNDGSLGPFSFALPINTQASSAGGIEIVPGVPTSH
jgi:hypothetical protein